MKNYKFNRVASLAIVLAVFFTIHSGCTYAFKGIKGDGNVVKQERDVSNFKGIDVGGAFKVYLTQGETEKLVVEADQNLMDVIETDVRAGVLKIKTSDDIKDATELNIYITFKDLNELDISGACDLIGENKFKLNDIDIDCSGASEVDMKFSATSVDIDCSGASNVDFYGSAESVNMDLSGASKIDAGDFEVEKYDIDVSGASSGKIYVTGELSVEVSGAANLKYKGDPKILEHDVSGAGSLRKI